MQFRLDWKGILAGALVASAMLVPGTALASASGAGAAASAAPAAAAQAAVAPAISSAALSPDLLSTAPNVLATSFGQRVVNIAMTYRGIPYRFGATGPYAYDCSGFVQSVFRRVGVRLPRTAAQQSRVGTFVAKSRLQPGDLVFFKNTYKIGVDHVGIYIGNGKFIDAWPHGGVIISSLSSPYFVRHYWGAKRVHA